MAKGLFITFEGIEGMGKSTGVVFLHQYLLEQGVDCIVTREPGGTEIAESIRNVLLKKYEEKMQDDTELLLFFAGRAQHIASVIKPALANDQWVLCDRFTDATYAYQGYGRGFDMERIEIVEQWVHGDLQPDVTLLFDAPVEVGRKRLLTRGQPGDRIEQEQSEFFERVRQGYLERASRFPDRYIRVDASQSIEEVELALQTIIEKYI